MYEQRQRNRALKRPTQAEVNKALDAHEKWLGGRRYLFGLIRAGKRADFSGMDLSGFDFGPRTVSGVLIPRDLRYAVFAGADLTKSTLTGADLRFANFQSATLNGATMNQVKLGHANMRSASLVKADISDAQCGNVNMQQARLEGAIMVRSGFQHANLCGAWLEKANMTAATFLGTNLTRINAPEAVAISTDFSGANLESADLPYADLRDAIFTDGQEIATETAPTTVSFGGAIARFIKWLLGSSTPLVQPPSEVVRINVNRIDLSFADLTGADTTAISRALAAGEEVHTEGASFAPRRTAPPMEYQLPDPSALPQAVHPLSYAPPAQRDHLRAPRVQRVYSSLDFHQDPPDATSIQQRPERAYPFLRASIFFGKGHQGPER